MKGGEQFNARLIGVKAVRMSTPDREIGGKMICSFGKRETIAKKAEREELLADGNGESWYVGYDAITDGGQAGHGRGGRNDARPQVFHARDDRDL